MITLSIDIGGTGIKMLPLDSKGQPLQARARRLTPKPASREAVLEVCAAMVAEQPAFDRISVGFPGVVVDGVVQTAPNLDEASWRGFDIQQTLTQRHERPVRVINDADLQGYGVIEGQGVELVLTLGTGMGSALFTDGRLVANLEFGHHPFRKGQTYEERIGEPALQRIGKRRWRRRVGRALAQLDPIFNYRRLHLGGGNAKKLPLPLPPRVVLFDNVRGLTGGVRLWDLERP